MKKWLPLRTRAHGQTLRCGRHRRSSSLIRLPANVCRARKIPRRGAAASFIISKDGTEAIKALGNQELPRQKAPTRTALTS
jgi:hypothetical protein